MTPMLGIMASGMSGNAAPAWGKDFTSRTSMPSAALWYCAAWNGSRWVAVAQTDPAGTTTTKTAWSSDAITWNAVATGVASRNQNIVWDGTYFVVTGNSSDEFYSTNGASWTLATGATTQQNFIHSATNGAGTTVAVAYTTGGNNLKYSTTGTSWTQITIGSSQRLNSIAYGNATFVVSLGATGNSVYTSTDGISWTLQSGVLPATQSFALVYGTKFIAMPYGTTTGGYSSNGTSWTSMTVPAGSYNQIGYSGGVYLAASYGTTDAISSTDGISWTARTLSSALTIVNVNGGNNSFVLMPGDTDTNEYITSP
jgi:hypothetical protein